MSAEEQACFKKVFGTDWNSVRNEDEEEIEVFQYSFRDKAEKPFKKFFSVENLHSRESESEAKTEAEKYASGCEVPGECQIYVKEVKDSNSDGTPEGTVVWITGYLVEIHGFLMRVELSEEPEKPVFMNCTPHRITLRQPDGLEINFDPCGFIPRVETSEEQVDFFTVPIVEQRTGQVSGFPDFDLYRGETGSAHIMCIVSRMVLDAVENIKGVTFVAPDSGKTAIRNEKGHIVAVTRLIRK